MTPEERQMVLSLVVVPGSGASADPAEFLRRMGASDGQALSVRLLRDAVSRRDPVDVEMALIVAEVFGVTGHHLELLLELAPAKWHFKHEDVVTLLGRLGSSRSVDALYQATQWVPEYLDFDESRALAVKAVRALGATPGVEAEEALRGLLGSEEPAIRVQASTQLRRRDRS